MPFFQLNWVILVVTLLFLVSFIVLEASFHFVSEVIGIAAYKLYLLILLMGSVAAFLNYTAIKIFGSWELLFVFILIAALTLVIIGFVIRSKIKQHKEKKALRKLQSDNEELDNSEGLTEYESENIMDKLD